MLCTGEGQGALKLIDLHGLHVSEAVDALRREVKAARARRQAARQPGTERVSVIVGTGHHTKVRAGGVACLVCAASAPCALEQSLWRLSRVPCKSLVWWCSV